MSVFLVKNVYIEMQDFKYGSGWPQILICGGFFQGNIVFQWTNLYVTKKAKYTHTRPNMNHVCNHPVQDNEMLSQSKI